MLVDTLLMHIGEEKSINIKYHVDDLLRMTGGFGRYQLTLFALVCLVSFPTGAQLSIPVFYAISPSFILQINRPSSTSNRIDPIIGKETLLNFRISKSDRMSLCKLA